MVAIFELELLAVVLVAAAVVAVSAGHVVVAVVAVVVVEVVCKGVLWEHILLVVYSMVWACILGLLSIVV